MVVAGIAVLLSFLFFLTVLIVMVLVRRGDAPSRRTSPEYDASRREAVRLLTGIESAPATSRSWRRGSGQVDPGPIEAPFRSALAEALRVDGLRAGGPCGGEGLEIGLVLVDPEPPGTDPRWVALPVQVLFPALERAGRRDLVDRFEVLAGRLA
jgi:hypothetical protein